MPIYEYKREDGSIFELIRTLANRDEVTHCPETGQPCERIAFSAGSHMLKGGGWAKDGYASQRKPPSGRSIQSHIDEHRSDLASQKEDYLKGR